MALLDLKGGAQTEDPRLDRVPSTDPRSADYPVAAVVRESAAVRSRIWRCPLVTDQGREGACVGHAWTHELRATPYAVRAIAGVPLGSESASRLYRRAQELDEWPGAEPDYSGTSVLAGAKAVQEQGALVEYRWTSGVDDVIRVLSNAGPVVLGIDWHDSSYRPRPSGLLDLSGRVVGGHAILALGVNVSGRLRGEPRIGEPLIRLRNSWGAGWGRNGDGFMRASDLERLLHAGGEGCVPIHRATPT